MVGFETSRLVEWGDCDAAGIVFYPNYFRWMDGTFHEMSGSLGFDQRILQRTHDGLMTPLIDVGCVFKAPVSFGTKINVSLTVTRLGSSSIALSYRFVSDGRHVAEGREARVFARLNGEELEKAEIPHLIRERLAQFYEG